MKLRQAKKIARQVEAWNPPPRRDRVARASSVLERIKDNEHRRVFVRNRSFVEPQPSGAHPKWSMYRDPAAWRAYCAGPPSL